MKDNDPNEYVPIDQALGRYLAGQDNQKVEPNGLVEVELRDPYDVSLLGL